MNRYFIAVQYVGSQYNGFQTQKAGTTIQDVINSALKTLLKQEVVTTTSSRTDAGVHAMVNYLHFDCAVVLSSKLRYNFNSILPNDISCMAFYKVNSNAHARFDALSRTYHYHVHQHKYPFLEKRSYFFPFSVDINLLNEAASIILGQKNYASFSKRNTQVNNFICNITASQWVATEEGQYTYVVTANRFLRGMVRALVSTMLLVGRKKISIEAFKEIIAAQDCTKANFSAPGHGLFLMDVEYPENLLGTKI